MSLLSLQTVTKIFGGLTAVNEVSFDVEQGSICLLYTSPSPRDRV